MKRIFSDILRLINRITDDKPGLYAAQASFFIVFSVTPFIMLLITLAKYFIPIDLDFILNEIYNYIPSNLASVVSGLVTDALDTSAGLISVSAASALWLASKGIMALFLGLNNIFKPEKKFGYFYTRAVSLVYTLIFIVALALTIAVFGFGQSVSERLAQFPLLAPLHAVLVNILKFKFGLFMVMLTLLFASFYTFLPRNKSFIKQLPGAAIAAAGWIIFSYIYSIYIESFSKYSYVYGSLTAIIFLMLWLYVCMNILLYGAELNKLHEEGFFKNK